MVYSIEICSVRILSQKFVRLFGVCKVLRWRVREGLERRMSPTSCDRAKHIVEVDERILAVFIVDSIGNMSELFVAEDANIDRSFIESIRSA